MVRLKYFSYGLIALGALLYIVGWFLGGEQALTLVEPVATPTAVSVVTQETTTATATPPPTPAAAPSSAPATSSTPAVKKPVKPAPVTASPVPAQPVITSAEAAAAIDAGLTAAATALRASLVNIICYAPAGGGIRSISGSGVIIDPKGVILTNAHIAQYYLFRDKSISCRVRTGSPAQDAYAAALIYLPNAWVENNADVLTKTNPTGTGEYDYALLAVTKSLTSAPLPTNFPFIPLATVPLKKSAPVVIGTYGAQFLEYSQIQSSLFPTIVFGSVKEIYTFAKNTIDVFALGGSAAAQEGSSGGGVVNAFGELAGTITTSTIEGATNTRELSAITASYIRAKYASETGEPLDTLFASPTASSIAAFAPKAAELEATLLSHLP
ncbi:MAG: serine protease [Patescibacteria group bacterium]